MPHATVNGVFLCSEHMMWVREGDGGMGEVE